MYHEEVFFNFSLMNKKDIAGFMLAGAAAIGGGTPAQSQNVTKDTAKTAAECLEAGGTMKYSANNGFVGCSISSSTKSEKPYVLKAESQPST